MIETLQFFRGESVDPYHNLALEEYLTETVGEGTCILYLWQNQHTVVIGRNQNAWQECRTTELERDGGHLARRLSGGGAVYHDLGNLNFTFCVRTADYDLRRQQSVLIEACRLLGISAELSGRNDLLADGRKFSGNSFYSHHGRSFHNGTLLVNVDMEKLGRYLVPSQAKLTSKGVSSVRSRVVNLAALAPGLTVEDVASAMRTAFETVYALPVQTLHEERFDRDDLARLRARFASYDWVYGKSIPFTFSCARRFAWGEVTIALAVEGGVCAEAAVYTDALDGAFASPLADALRGCRFAVEALCARVNETAACAPCASDLCALLREQDI